MKKQENTSGRRSGGRSKTVSVAALDGASATSGKGNGLFRDGDRAGVAETAVIPGPLLVPFEIGNAIYDTQLTRKFRSRKNWVRPDERLVLAFIPGTIQKIFIKEGMKIEPGTPLLILEAMKMRNELISPISGVVKRIHVSEGDMVPKNHLLVEVSTP
jgi:biotin carboxyl carrier protein